MESRKQGYINLENHNCKNYLEYIGTIDKFIPFGDITSMAVFKCSKCGKEFTEEELNFNFNLTKV